MLDEKQREEIALRRFGLIAPILNGQVENQEEYFKKLAASALEMPHWGWRRYSPRTFRWWLVCYRAGGLDALKPGYRSDRGKSRRITLEMAEKIEAKRKEKPGLCGTLLYDALVREGVFTPDKVSLATFYRFLANNPGPKEECEEREVKRFSYQGVNELWQADIMHGPYLKAGRIRKPTYLVAFIDDASRLIPHAEFFWEQNFGAVRRAFKEAVLKRGVPKLLYTDNGKVYRCGQLSVICASLGCVLLHARPFSPQGRGKIERFFKTVRLRFLSLLDPDKIGSLEELNLRFWQWLDEDYQRKPHAALGMSPLDYFLSQADRVRLLLSPALVEEHFLLRVTRKVHHDATFTLENLLYETEPRLANMRLEVRYEPEWLASPARPVFLYRDGVKVGEARQVDFLANAGLKRRKSGRPPHEENGAGERELFPPQPEPKPASPISFARLLANDPGEGED
ncbi:MAG: DDE-type integrase/transposase/recombinase [Clostridia bacterium]|nr:DDE-type integrase/transposase/recombinase [Clostridia bacterium]